MTIELAQAQAQNLRGTMQIELAQAQAQNLLQLIDIAVKAGGLQVAKPAYDVAALIQQAIDLETKPEVDESEAFE